MRVWWTVNESKMPYLVWFFNHSVFLQNHVWRKSKRVWKDTGRDRKEIEIFNNDTCFYHLRDYQSDRESLAQYWPPPVLWRSMWLERCLILLRPHSKISFFLNENAAPKIFFAAPLFRHPSPLRLLSSTTNLQNFPATHVKWARVYG